MEEKAHKNTDIELFREKEEDYYSASLHKTQDGNIGINVGGIVYVKSLREWHKLQEENKKLRGFIKYMESFNCWDRDTSAKFKEILNENN